MGSTRSAFSILRDGSYAYPRPDSFLGSESQAPEAAFSPRPYLVRRVTVANGVTDGTDTLGEAVTFRYSSLKPSWRMDFAIAKYTS
jgi:hypothetical protein